MNNKLIPTAIVIAGVLVAGAVLFKDREAAGPSDTLDTAPREQQEQFTIHPLADDDHLRGNPGAPVTILEFSDIDCPFCGQFHATMNQVMEEYGKDGRVAWVYRHFPLDSLHPDARRKAEASECVAALSDEVTFWSFLDVVFEVEDETLSDLSLFAENLNVSVEAFEQCASGGTYTAEVQKDFDDARGAGGSGTPHNVFVFEKPISELLQDSITTQLNVGALPGQPNVAFSGDGTLMYLIGARDFITMQSLINSFLADLSA